MPECAFCGQPMRPGATFCPACGHAPAATPAPGVTPARAAPAAPGQPNPRAAIAIVSMPVVLLGSVLAFGVISRTSTTDASVLVGMLLIGSLVGGIAWAVWKGATWARWLALVATSGWAIFMAWTVPQSIEQLRYQPLQDHPAARNSALFGLVLACAQLGLAAGTLYFLLRPGRARS